MIKYQLYDQYGRKIHEHCEDATDCGTIMLCFKEAYYRPVAYDLASEPNIAKCIPVSVIECGGKKK